MNVYKKHELTALRSAIIAQTPFDDSTVCVSRRDCLLAYAFLRGIPYRIAESTAVPFRSTKERSLILALAILTVMPAPASPSLRTSAAKELAPAVQAWLELPEPTERREARLARLSAARVVQVAKLACDLERWAAWRAARVAS